MTLDSSLLRVVMLGWCTACSTIGEPGITGGDPSPDSTDVPAVCGDGTCTGNETCSSCSTDCGTCATSSCNFDATVQFDYLGDILQLESVDHTTCVWISRTLSKGCTTTSCVQAGFTMVASRVGHAPVVAIGPVLGAGETLTWTDTHHNFSDSAEMSTSDTRYFLQLTGGEPRPAQFVAAALTATDRVNGSTIWGPIALEPYHAP